MAFRDAIVLRSFVPLQQKLVILDCSEGKKTIGVAHLKTFPPHASLIRYTSHVYHHRVRVGAVDMLALPANAVQRDIYFLHLVLEILVQCVPESQRSEDVFSHCGFLFDDVTIAMFPYPLFKRLFLVKLFVLMGIHPHESIFRRHFDVYRLILHPLVTMVRYIQVIDSEALSTWLDGCLQAHPHLDTLVTLKWWRMER